MKRTLFYLLLIMAFLTACSPKTNTLGVEMGEFGFTPNHLTVRAGAPVTLHLKNHGALEHDLMILTQGETAATPFHPTPTQVYWKVALDAGEEVEQHFTAPTEPGEYLIVCDVAGHLEQGMQATLTVTP